MRPSKMRCNCALKSANFAGLYIFTLCPGRTYATSSGVVLTIVTNP